jgi:hypothetical protein
MTSPPYWALRDYGAKGQLGLEPDFREYVSKLLMIFDELKRVLKRTGSFYLNMGDTYSGGGSHSKLGGVETWGKLNGMKEGFPDKSPQASITNVIPAKSMIGIPWRVALGLIDGESNDIYELRKNLTSQEQEDLLSVIHMNKSLQHQENHDNYSVQELRQAERILPGLWEEVEDRAQGRIQEKNGGMAKKQSRQNKTVFPEILLDSPRKRNSSVHERECETPSTTKTASSHSLWERSADMRVLGGIQNPFPFNRPHQWQRQPAQEGSEKIRVDLRVAEPRRLPNGLQGPMHELQFRNGPLWNVPSSRGKRIRLRKYQIPTGFLRFFKLVKPERWILRNAIVWSKPNSMPASVKDRLSNSYEHIFHFVKSRKYYYDLDAIRVPHKFSPKSFNIRVRDAQKSRLKSKWGVLAQASHEEVKAYDEKIYPKYPPHEPRHFQLLSMGIRHGGHTGKTVRHDHPLGKNPGDVWEINSKPHSFAHFAVYPEEICVRPIVSSCPERVCVKCGSPQLKAQRCDCDADFRPGIVLDMFAGSGTTLVVAKRLGRDFVGIELNPEYVKIAKQRLAKLTRLSEPTFFRSMRD